MNEWEMKEEYKRVFDEIHASDELKNKILIQKNPKRRNIYPILATVSSVAAAVVVFGAVKDYNFERNNNGVISEVVSEHTETPTETVSEIEEIYTEPPVNETNQSIKTTDLPVAKVDVPKQKATPNVSENTSVESAQDIFESVTEIPEVVVEPTSEPVHNTSEVQLNINSPSVAVSGAGAKVASYALGTGDEYITEEWDNNRYFNYIGKDIINDLKYSEDLMYTGETSVYFDVNSEGIPVDDTRLFIFAGTNGRLLQITVSRDLSYVNGIISDAQVILSNVNGTDIAVFSDNGEYTVLAIYNGTSYVINTIGLTEAEVVDLLGSF